MNTVILEGLCVVESYRMELWVVNSDTLVGDEIANEAEDYK
jgi:hypothetical protein